MNVLLNDGTVGYTEYANIGDVVVVNFHDENGLPCKKIGKVIDIL